MILVLAIIAFLSFSLVNLFISGPVFANLENSDFSPDVIGGLIPSRHVANKLTLGLKAIFSEFAMIKFKQKEK